MMNAIEAMSRAGEDPRELLVRSAPADPSDISRPGWYRY